MKFVKIVPTKEEYDLVKSIVTESDKLKALPPDSVLYAFKHGVTTKEDLEYFFFGSYDDLHQQLMSGMSKAIAYLVEHKEYHYVVMGDYDTDGCMATVVMTKGLRSMGYKVDYYMNSRFVDGYGLKIASVKEIRKAYPSVNCIITVDNGIIAYEAIEYAQKMGIEVIVTDHHKPGAEQPKCLAVIDPKQDWLDDYPFREICGAVVAWKLIYHLANTTGKDYDNLLKNLLVFAGVATVGDQMPLFDENRIIIRHAIKYLNSRKCPLFFLYMQEKLQVDSMTEETIGFYISPVINAMGRITGNPISVVEACLSDNYDHIKQVVDLMFTLNEERRVRTKEQVGIAEGIIESIVADSRALVVQNEIFNEGIVGLIAGRLCEKYYVPVFAFSAPNEQGICKGSGRSILGVDAMDILYNCSDLIEQFGGHAPACGLSIKAENIDAFRKRVNQYLADYSEDLFVKKVPLFFRVHQDMIDFHLLDIVTSLRPFGQKFREPLFLVNNFKIDIKKSTSNKAKSVYVGKNSDVLRLVNDNGIVAIGFKSADRYKELEEPSLIKLVGKVSENIYRGNSSVQFVIEENYIYK